MLIANPFPATMRRPLPPPGMTVYALSDIHGCADLLAAALDEIEAHHLTHPAADRLHVFLGDYIDRGPDSRRVIQMLIEWGARHRSVFLKGNHEGLLLDVLNHRRWIDYWPQLGGLQTLKSYGIHAPFNPGPDSQPALVDALIEAMPQAHRRFLDDLQSFFIFGDFYFTHAGVRPGVPLTEQNDRDLMWIRGEFLNCRDDFGKYIVHGHTPVLHIDVQPNRINIDTGAYGTGNLTVLALHR